MFSHPSFNLLTRQDYSRHVVDLYPGADLLPALQSRKSAHHFSNGSVDGTAVTQCCLLLPNGEVLVGGLVAVQSNSRAYKDASKAQGPTCMRPEAALITANLAHVGTVGTLGYSVAVLL